MSEFSNVWKGLDWSALLNIFLSIIPALICITFHELSHGFVACKLGDDTAKNAGRLTLNPIKHIDPMGLLMMLIFKFGWAKPVPVNMNNFKNPKGAMAVTALAGPLANVLLAAVFLLLYGFSYTFLNTSGDWGRMILDTIYLTSYISIALAIFNMIPIPPLDGAKVLFSLLPNEYYYKLMRYERYGMLLLMAFIMLTRMAGSPLATATEAVHNWLFNIADWAFGLYQKII